MKDKDYIKRRRELDFSEPWSIFKIMADFVDGFEMLNNLTPSVTVFGSARVSSDNKYYKKAEKLGYLMAQRGVNVITGGSNGIMEAANKGACKSKKALSIGLNVDLPNEQSSNKFLDYDMKFDYFFSRKVMLIKYSYAYIIFPGGFGTMDELFEALTLIQTKKIFPIGIFLYGSSYWTPLLKFIEQSMLEEGAITQDDFKIIKISDSIDEIVEFTYAHMKQKFKEMKRTNMHSYSSYNKLKSFLKERKYKKKEI